MITYEEGEKRALWEEAQAIALKEPPESLDLMTIRSHAKIIEQGNMKRAVVIAQKLAVWRKVIKKVK
jgi:ABC-type Na+ transport system ATPase subunit NatA